MRAFRDKQDNKLVRRFDTIDLLEHTQRALASSSSTTLARDALAFAWHLLAAAARLHGRASTGGRPRFGERETADAVALIRQALCELNPLLASGRRLELRATVAPAALSMDAQLRFFASTVPGG